LLLFGPAYLVVLAGLASLTYAVVLLAASNWGDQFLAGNVSIFMPLERAVLSRSVRDAERTKMITHSAQSLAGALGALASVDILALAFSR